MFNNAFFNSKLIMTNPQIVTITGKSGLQQNLFQNRVFHNRGFTVFPWGICRYHSRVSVMNAYESSFLMEYGTSF